MVLRPLLFCAVLCWISAKVSRHSKNEKMCQLFSAAPACIASSQPTLLLATGLLEKGIHPTVISDAFGMAVRKAEEVLESIATPVELSAREELIKAAITSMASKVISQNSDFLAPLAVDAVLSVTDPAHDTNVDLNDVKVTKAVGGTIDDTELVHGLVFNRKASHVAGAPSRVENAKVGLIQFCLSAPKTDMENSVVVSDYTQMDKILAEERKYILNLCKQIKKSGCNVLLVQKSILRDALNEWSLHFLAKMKIMVVRDVERDDIEFIAKTLGCKPVAHVDHMTPDKLGSAELAEEVSVGSGGKVIKITGVANPGRTVSLLVRGSNKLVVDETERSIHDALCVVRSIVKKRFLITGGGIPETEVALALTQWSKTLTVRSTACVLRGIHVPPTFFRRAKPAIASAPSPTPWRSSRTPLQRTRD